ncbi:MAG: M24 family metallopeptidase [Acidobacteriota bacterium]
MSDGATLISEIQALLKESGLSAWLFFDFRGSDPIAYRILGLDPASHATRRWLYLIPAEGMPTKIVHRIEAGRLDALPGEKQVYLEWTALHEILAAALNGHTKVAMQYSPRNDVPYVSKVDGGMLELIRQSGVEVVTSADLVQQFECVWDAKRLQGHRRTANIITALVREAFELAVEQIRDQGHSDELAIQEFIMRRLAKEELETDFPPIVAVNQNAGNPHYGPEPAHHSSIQAESLLLIDLWARHIDAESVFADITWTAWMGSSVPPRVAEVFEVVRQARDTGVEFLNRRLARGHVVHGWEVDDAVRKVIQDKGYGEYFIHRTGHNLGHEVHGNGVNFDNLETHDNREVLPGVCCTIEPGIYLPDFGIRSEIDVFVKEDGVEVTTPPQEELISFSLD